MIGRVLRASAAAAGVLAVLLLGAPTAAAEPEDGGGACLAEIREAWEDAEPYVHDRVTGVLPEVTPDAVADAFADDRSVRVAVLPGEDAAAQELASQVHGAQERRTVVLYRWDGHAFQVDAGAAGPRGVGGRLLEDRVAPEDLLSHMETLSAALRGEVTSAAAQALAQTPLYAAPGLATDLTPQRTEELAERLAALPDGVRVALLPGEAVAYESAVLHRGSGSVADLVQGERDAPVVVYLVDEEGNVVAGSVGGSAAASRFGPRGAVLARIAEDARRDGGSATATLTGLLERLEETSDGEGPAGRAADALRHAGPFLLLVGAVLALVVPVRRAEAQAAAEDDGDSAPPPE